ncbi:MAG: glycogen debranching enzyme family protein [Bacteroidales bacterium]|nr:glycogen debranching enzyme family protein [Bacteroidales bacterium]
MSYIEFDKNKLINLGYSLKRELLRSNRAGAYSSRTIIGCNTRKYHGLLVAPQPGIDNENHILLSNMDEVVIQRDASFNLGIHKYPGGVYNPGGHKYVRDFNTEPIPNILYRVGGVMLRKELIFAESHDRIMIRYTLEDAHSPTKLRFNPFLAFRNIHKLSKANFDINDKHRKVPNGIRMRLYNGYTPLFMQFSKKVEYTHSPEWYYNIEYQEEMERGYDYQEDLFVPGFFEVEIKKGESIVFCAGTSEVNPATIKRAFTAEVKKRTPRDDFENCLRNSAQQFIIKRDGKTWIVAGFPWFDRWGRDTFIALPGLTLVNDDPKSCKAVIDAMLTDLKGPLFPNIGEGSDSAYNSVDAPLWFFWTLQQYADYTGEKKEIWNAYGRKMKMILDGYRKGTDFNIHMQDNGLIWAGAQGHALSWMDAVVDGKAVTPRIGLAVEVNALWYNAIRFSMELAEASGDDKFISKWKDIAEMIPASFVSTFWDEKHGYLADYVDGEGADWSVRPNQIIAASLPYRAIGEEISMGVIDVVQKELLTARGLRTLSPKNINYKGTYFGNQPERDRAYHQGTVWPWLFGHFAEAYLRIHGKEGVNYIKDIYKGFEAVMTEAGIGSVSEVYDGDPPHLPGGTISQAWSVSELLRTHALIKKYNRKRK